MERVWALLVVWVRFGKQLRCAELGSGLRLVCVVGLLTLLVGGYG